MYDQAEKDQPGLEFNASKEAANAIYPVYPVADDRLEILGDCRNVPESTQQKPRHNPFGLRPLWFGILIAATTTIIIGAAIGGGIGGAMARSSSNHISSLQNSSSLPVPVATTGTSASATSVSVTLAATATATATPNGEYAPLAPSNVKLLQHTCPSENYTYQINGDPFPPQIFKWQCQTAWLGNNRGTAGITLMQLSAYTAEQCVEACGGMNVWRNQQICSAVTFQASMSSEYTVGRGNCWLFNSTQATWNDPGALTCISATL